MANRFGRFVNDSSNDRALLESLIRENNECHGFPAYYLPKEYVNLDKIFGEAMQQKFENAYYMDLITESHGGFQGGEKLYNKFGINMNFTSDLYIGIEHFQDITDMTEPVIGDIIFIPMFDKFYKITNVNNRYNFYQSGKLYVFKIDVEVLMSDSSDYINTGVDEIDDAIPTDTDGFIETDNDIIDEEELKEELFQDFDEIYDINILDD